jgi:6-phosphogluconolactonase (cycloisomerase 2 family)
MCQKTFIALVTVGILSLKAYTQAPAGTVYIESNIGDQEGQNSVVAFTRDTSGVLTTLGAFPTKGTGVHPVDPPATVTTLNTTFGPLASDQNLILTPDGKHLYAVNSGSDTIAGFNVHTDGSLTPIKGSPFRSFGKNPVSLGLAGADNVLVVVNKDYDLGRTEFDVQKRKPNYVSFKINNKGQLVRIPKSTIITQKGGRIGLGFSNPTQALVAPGGHVVFDADYFGYQIHSLNVVANGRLVEAESQLTPVSELQSFPPLAGVRALPVPLGLAVHPEQPILYAGFVFDGRAGIYYYDDDGDFVFLRSVAVGAGPCNLRVNAAGTRLYASNSLGNSISTLDITDPYNPVKMQEFTLQSPPDIANGASPNAIDLDPSGNFLYAITIKALAPQSNNANALHVLKLAADGTVDSQTARFQFNTVPSVPQGIVSQ